MIRFSDSGRRTQAMKVDGRCLGSGAEDSEVLEVDLMSSREEKIPERMAVPSVPASRYKYFVMKFEVEAGWCSLTTSQDCKGQSRLAGRCSHFSKLNDSVNEMKS